MRINDDATANSQFLPRIAIDNSTGNLGVSWYDSRNDPSYSPRRPIGHCLQRARSERPRFAA